MEFAGGTLSEQRSRCFKRFPGFDPPRSDLFRHKLSMQSLTGVVCLLKSVLSLADFSTDQGRSGEKFATCLLSINPPGRISCRHAPFYRFVHGLPDGLPGRYRPGSSRHLVRQSNRHFVRVATGQQLFYPGMTTRLTQRLSPADMPNDRSSAMDQ